jgi:trimeric autotransporter adhesin
MKLKTYITTFLLLVISSLHAQVGIGTTTPDASSMLDITSANSGLLIPRVALASTSDITTIALPVTSLLVYNSGFSPNGYYYWNGSIWVQLAVASNNNWLLTGNSGTTIATNFFGTTDNTDIVFKRYNVRAGYIGDPTYDGSFNFTNGNTVFGANSMLSPTISFATQDGVRNTAFGVNVMPGLTTGRINTGVGEFALFSNTSGIGNTAIGSGTLFSNSTASFNVAVGRQALTTSNADNNTAVGFAALRQNASGTNNTAMGYEALRGVLGSGNVGIGYQAGRLETGSNKLYIENSNADASNALIYGEFDNNIVRVNGTLQISNPASAPGYSLPNVRGTAGQVLQTNGAGSTLWADDNSTMSVTRTNLSTNQALATTGWQKITFNTIVFDLNTEFNTGTNRFVAAKAGYYQVNAGYHTNDQSNTQYYSIGVYKNGVLYQMNAGNHTNLGLVSRNIDCVVSLAIGDYIEIYAENYQTGVNLDSYSGKTYFEVKQIR